MSPTVPAPAASDDPEPPEYPGHWEADVVLRDGSTMRIRPIRPTDADALQRFHLAQSPESVYLRFFAPLARLTQRDLARFTRVDHRDRVALVLVAGDEILAVGRYDRIDDTDDAEVAFNVSDRAQGRGVGSVLLEHLAAAGRERGIGRFVADVLPANTRMIRVFSDAGYDVRKRFDDGIVTVSFTIHSTDRSMEVLAERERRAESLSMRRILAATSVLVHGSGQEGAALAGRVWEHVAGAAARPGGFTGRLVHTATEADLAALAGPFDLAVVGRPHRRCCGSCRTWPGSTPARCSCSPAASPRPGARAPRRRTSCGCCDGRASGSSGHGPSACSPGASPAPCPRCSIPGSWTTSLARALRAPRASASSARARTPPAPCSTARAGAGSPSRPCSRPVTARTSRATTRCSSGPRTPAPRSPASTSSPWAIRASSPGSPVGSPRTVRSSCGSRAAPGRCARPATRCARPGPRVERSRS
ncbi:GNAT family N-acetyltransferase [Pseudactinotalea sp. HY158]|nr:GNAT family N-acetyltransferase [Pseudactinotalea sp. HY158]